MASDFELIQRVLSGDGAAFNELVLRHRKHVYETAYRMVRNHEVAEEIAQEAFIRAYRGLGSFRREAGFTTWLYRITMNLCFNELNRKKEISEPNATVTAFENASAVENMVREERREWLERQIEALPVKQKSVLILRVFREMPFKDIARIVGCSAGAAKVNFRHAFLKLKEQSKNLREEL
ncbi:MAG: sigma-70 family RNA polymerase sigma factor [Candidatus Abyssobacteria bacterium SURF_5]|uniref:RNA polymerase sigma factor n=1 Tax=Abyssobacteria bacterium (strain SURF_5) TaxID=2093360 RepID=A0A3A4NS84_ABYX5|nr:MAG: sigma-70 family RNA polymerase sigma factor [Candidatus Abyssubacteria bacterium SURF_5]